jgi:tRNA U55 pseudouridine synthase TruB
MDGPEVTVGRGSAARVPTCASLAHDIGQALGCGAHLAGLRRTASGPLRVEDARTPEQWSQWFDEWVASRDVQTG